MYSNGDAAADARCGQKLTCQIYQTLILHIHKDWNRMHLCWKYLKPKVKRITNDEPWASINLCKILWKNLWNYIGIICLQEEEILQTKKIVQQITPLVTKSAVRQEIPLVIRNGVHQEIPLFTKTGVHQEMP